MCRILYNLMTGTSRSAMALRLTLITSATVAQSNSTIQTHIRRTRGYINTTNQH